MKESTGKKVSLPNWCMYLEFTKIMTSKGSGITIMKTYWDEYKLLLVKAQVGRTYMHTVCKWQQKRKPVYTLRMDNAGKNKKLLKKCKSANWKLGIEIECATKDMPQKNQESCNNE